MNSKKELPFFKYNPNVYESSVAFHKEGVCQCCGKTVSVYTNAMYTPEDINCICFDCVADGSAAKKFQGEFIQDVEKKVSDESKTEELFYRTPGYDSWQGEYWLTCCDDYCQYIGDVGGKELDEMDIGNDVILECEEKRGFKIDKNDIEKCGSLSGYLFKCLHCGKYHLWVDFD